jgi:hypothetical protein
MLKNSNQKSIWLNFKFKFWFKTSKNAQQMCQTWVNFAKDYQKDSYNKTYLMGKKLRGSKPINHIKKKFIP